MLKGTNELQLNQATMIEAVDYWLTNKVLNPHEPKPRVSQVQSHGHSGLEFVVTLSEPSVTVRQD